MALSGVIGTTKVNTGNTIQTKSPGGSGTVS